MTAGRRNGRLVLLDLSQVQDALFWINLVVLILEWCLPGVSGCAVVYDIANCDGPLSLAAASVRDVVSSVQLDNASWVPLLSELLGHFPKLRQIHCLAQAVVCDSANLQKGSCPCVTSNLAPLQLELDADFNVGAAGLLAGLTFLGGILASAILVVLWLRGVKLCSGLERFLVAVRRARTQTSLSTDPGSSSVPSTSPSAGNSSSFITPHPLPRSLPYSLVAPVNSLLTDYAAPVHLEGTPVPAINQVGATRRLNLTAGADQTLLSLVKQKLQDDSLFEQFFSFTSTPQDNSEFPPPPSSSA